MQIQVLGPGCPKCHELAKRTEEAVKQLGIDASIEKIIDVRQIMGFGVLTTPALAVDGKVKFSGRVPSVAELTTILVS